MKKSVGAWLFQILLLILQIRDRIELLKTRNRDSEVYTSEAGKIGCLQLKKGCSPSLFPLYVNIGKIWLEPTDYKSIMVN